MWIDKPYHRNYRSHIEWTNSWYSNWAFIVDKEYAKSPEHYLRAFIIIQDDLKKMFEYIEPADDNLTAYSYRIHELFMRTCIEIEANCKAILRENIYNPKDSQGILRKEKQWNIKDYKKINITHHLSSYKVIFPIRNWTKSSFQPFAEWKNTDNLSRYTAYNNSKHNRQEMFSQANFNNLLHAITGLLVILSSQFRTEEFSPSTTTLGINTDSYYDQWTSAIGDFFRIEFPNDWEDNEKYEFNWNDLKKEKNKFQQINYDNI